VDLMVYSILDFGGLAIPQPFDGNRALTLRLKKYKGIEKCISHRELIRDVIGVG